MRILVFSDTHGDIRPCIKTINNIKDVDMIIHAGDHISDAHELMKCFSDIPFFAVRGNCDFSNEPSELIVEADGKKIFVTHGHLYNVKLEYDYYTLKKHTEELGCDAAVFGHSHIPYNENLGKMCIINPGSVKTSRTFGVIEVENGKLRTATCNLY